MIQLLLIDSGIKDTIHVYSGNEFNIHTASSALHALNLLIKLQPDMLIINSSNVAMDFCKLLKRIRNMQAGKELPIILLFQCEEELDAYKDMEQTTFLPCDSTLDTICSEVSSLLQLHSVTEKSDIVVIDDDLTLLEIVKLYLGAYYNIIPFSTTKEALEYLACHPIQLILLDVAMPDMDGRMMFTKIREIPCCKEVPILFQTGMAGMQTVQDCLKLGPAGYIVKPLQKKQLLMKVHDALTGPVTPIPVKRIALLDNNPLQHTNFKATAEECSLESFEILPGIKGFSTLNVEDYQYICINLDNSSSWLSMLRGKLNHHNIPLILLTSEPDSEVIFNELNIPGTYMQTLPLTKDSLLDIIKRIDEELLAIQSHSL